MCFQNGRNVHYETTVSHSGSLECFQNGWNRDSETTVSHSGSACASKVVGMFILRLQFRILDHSRASKMVGSVIRRLQFRILDQSRAFTMVGMLLRRVLARGRIRSFNESRAWLAYPLASPCHLVFARASARLMSLPTMSCAATYAFTRRRAIASWLVLTTSTSPRTISEPSCEPTVRPLWSPSRLPIANETLPTASSPHRTP